MTTSTIYDTLVTANVAKTDFIGSGGTGEDLKDFALSIETHTAGLGNLLATLEYFDGQNVQQLNVSMLLTVANAIEQMWPNIWIDKSQSVSLQWTYLGGIVSGSADIKLLMRE